MHAGVLLRTVPPGRPFRDALSKSNLLPEVSASHASCCTVPPCCCRIGARAIGRRRAAACLASCCTGRHAAAYIRSPVQRGDDLDQNAAARPCRAGGAQARSRALLRRPVCCRTRAAQARRRTCLRRQGCRCLGAARRRTPWPPPSWPPLPHWSCPGTRLPAPPPPGPQVAWTRAETRPSALLSAVAVVPRRQPPPPPPWCRVEPRTPWPPPLQHRHCRYASRQVWEQGTNVWPGELLSVFLHETCLH